MASKLHKEPEAPSAPGDVEAVTAGVAVDAFLSPEEVEAKRAAEKRKKALKVSECPQLPPALAATAVAFRVPQVPDDLVNELTPLEVDELKEHFLEVGRARARGRSAAGRRAHLARVLRCATPPHLDPTGGQGRERRD